MLEIKLSDYKKPFFWIKKIDLDIDLYENETFITSTLVINKNTDFDGPQVFELDGIDLEIVEFKINGNDFKDYKYSDDKLTFNPASEQFVMVTKVKIHPEKNFTLDGLYKSGSIFCTQCEAEGFRRITFYQDRPDVMAIFSTIIRADKKSYPVLLSNGNKVDSGDLDNGRHFAKWEDPFLKPAYLFAVVAGDLGLVSDSFTTKSGRDVKLEIFVDPGNEDKCAHAMKSLQNSMKWDEDVFGLEYDLDIYMIVAVDTFNMGAMENKGLNIFNSAYVLAKKETATDSDFQGIEAVIAHEYFHNWTGNRVTCRDWFQLTLKEGLTVFRDQEFSSDMLSRPVKRIEDVKVLRSHQFSEDAGPLSHPIKPKSYIEINNFYTATIYEKGAEVIRMIHTLVGAENFRKGMDLYFKRHDGQAVTTEDFVSAISDASSVNLEQFKVWYDQNGTPELIITTNYDEDQKTFSFTIDQKVNLNNSEYDALHMPFSFGLLSESGVELHNERIELTKKSETFTVENVMSNPIPSWNRGFTAPVIIDYKYTIDQLIKIMSSDTDEFNQYNATQDLYFNIILGLVSDLSAKRELKLDDSFEHGFGELLKNSKLDEAFKAYALSMPGEMDVNEKLAEFDYENVKEAINFVKSKLANIYTKEFDTLYSDMSDMSFDLDAKSMGRRSLKNTCLSYLTSGKCSKSFSMAKTQYNNATNMNDEISSLKNIVHNYPENKEEFVDSFYNKWKSEPLVMQKWLGVQASAPYMTIDDIKLLEKTDIYDSKVPNYVRSILRNCIRTNPSLINKPDGSGYEFLVDRILEIDTYNPSLASGLAKSLNHIKKIDNNRASKLKSQLSRLLEGKLSKDTFEVVSKNLNG